MKILNIPKYFKITLYVETPILKNYRHSFISRIIILSCNEVDDGKLLSFLYTHHPSSIVGVTANTQGSNVWGNVTIIESVQTHNQVIIESGFDRELIRHWGSRPR